MSVSYFSISLDLCTMLIMLMTLFPEENIAEKQAMGMKNMLNITSLGEIIGEKQAYETQLFAHIRWTLLSQRSRKGEEIQVTKT